MKRVFLAWQDPESRSWFPIGRLTGNGERYQFVYTRGVMDAAAAGFRPLQSFQSLSDVYESDELFPLFANRLPSRERPDYDEFISWLDVPRHADDPVALLARSGGRRQTDTFEVFPCPEPDDGGRYHIHFFAHGLRHLAAESIDRVVRLELRERLLLFHDLQNPHDPQAIGLRTNDAFPGDRYLVGYCPRYLQADLIEIIQRCAEAPVAAVERVNPPPAPLQYRLLCNLTGCWPDGFSPCSAESYQPLARGVLAG